MAHIHSGPGQHDLTVSAFIVRVADDGPRLLLHRHKKLGLMLQPGGPDVQQISPERAGHLLLARLTRDAGKARITIR